MTSNEEYPKIAFNEIDTDFKTYSPDDLEEGMEVYADIGEYITDLRTATITEIHTDDRRVSLSIGEARMDDPYVVSLSRIHDIVSN